MGDLLNELRWRGLLHQCSDETGLNAHLASGRRHGYIGFDPTADSLTIGNLVQITQLARLGAAGHDPLVVMGGGTGTIGDPGGKSAERPLLSLAEIESNVNGQRRIFDAMLPGATILNNIDWLAGLGYLEVLREVGKLFSVNAMVARDSVRSRLETTGISYTEFSYMVLQAYDFAHLHKEHGVTLQMGGSDQWGNIVSGVDLIHRLHGGAAFALTTPLLTKADGGKFGKSESGAVWLTADRTSPYAFHQFWMNTDDADLDRYLKTFSFLDRDSIAELLLEHRRDPGRRSAQRVLASEITARLHGATACQRVEAAASALFTGRVGDLDAATLAELCRDVPTTDHSAARLHDGVDLVELLAETGLAQSRRQAREFLEHGSIAINGHKVGPDRRLEARDLLPGEIVLLRRGKKQWHATTWRRPA